MSKKIPIKKANKIAKEYDYDGVIIIGVNEDSSGHITTYGKDKQFCKIMGELGQQELGTQIFKENGLLWQSTIKERLEKLKNET